MPLCPTCGAINTRGTISCKRCGHNLPSAAAHGETGDLTRRPQHADNDEIFSRPEGRSEESPFTHQSAPATTRGASALDQFSNEQPAWQNPEDPMQPERRSNPFRGEPDGMVTRGGYIEADPEPVPRYFGTRPDLTGRIFLTSERPAEPPDLDPWLWVSRFLVLTLIAGILLLSWEEAQKRLGFIVIACIVVFFWLISRFRGLGMLLIVAVLGLGRLFGGLFRAPQEMLPVRLCRLYDDQGREHIIRIKGRIIGGDIDQEDRLALWGRQRQGTWIFRRGFNIRPRSWILVEGSYTWITAIIFSLLNLWLVWRFAEVHPEWFF